MLLRQRMSQVVLPSSLHGVALAPAFAVALAAQSRTVFLRNFGHEALQP